MSANRPGPGSHVATASFMVAADGRGQGIGGALVRDALDWARARGFAGMQFNAVAASNTSAVELYERHGFTIVGTVPGAFEHPTLGALFGAYASSQDAYTIGAYERLFYAAGLDTPKIIAAYVPELLAPAPTVTWRRLQGMEIDRPGRPVAVRRLTEPTRKAHRQDWNTTLP
jgi:GNAT superfamily N-acetyltransferase